MSITSDPNADRKRWLSVLAKSSARAVAHHWAASGFAPAHTIVRAPEIGGVMVRGQAGGTGAAFNLGEMTVTRATIRLTDGTVGHGYVQGRDKDHARTAALVDGLMQTDIAAQVRAALIDPLEAALHAAKDARAAKAAATKVDFFTLVRGED